MQRSFAITLVAISLLGQAGCSSCGGGFSRFFNRGDSCRTCADAGCANGHCEGVHDVGAPGLLSAPSFPGTYSPGSVETLPGPATIIPSR